MPVKMQAHQLEFWQELLSPFPERLLSTKPGRGGRELTWIDKRAITNRLDSICGPNGWSVEYEETAHGYKAKLGILCPTAGDAWVWHYKEDGAGFEEMATADDNEKSGYTNALRRVAQDAWGMGRYLYQKGIPTFLDPNATPFEDGPRTSPAKTPSTVRPPASAPAVHREETEDHTSEQSTFKPAPAPAAPAQATKPKFDNFKIPKPGKSVFAWCMEMSKEFECELKGGMGNAGEERGWGSKFADWNEEQVREVCMTAIAHIRELPTYKGQYEYLFPGGAAPAPTPKDKPSNDGVNVAAFRRVLVDKMKALLSKQMGRDPSQSEIKVTFDQVASSSANSQGHMGEVPDKLATLTDATWISNMIKFVDCQIAEAMAHPDGEEIPF